MLRRGLLLIVLGPSLSWACESILKSSPRQIPFSKLRLPPHADLVGEIAGHSLIFPVEEGRKGFWTVVFDPRPDQKNEGYLIEGQVRDGQYFGFSVRHTKPDDEKDFFKQVARMHGLKDQTIRLSRKHAECETVFVNAWIEAKLWLKHGLNVRDVRALLESPESVRVYDDGFRDRRYRIQTHDRRGRSIAIVIAEKENCPNVLVTAYEEN
jgi:hypothetical protein